MFASFMVNTWLVGSIVAVVAGAVGFFVVLRGSSFAAHALPLGTFPGAAAASLLGLNQMAGLVVFAGLGVVGISRFGRRGHHDVATALCLVTLMGLGALFLSFTQEYSQAVYALLFGEVLGVTRADLLPVALAGALAIASLGALFRPLLLSSLSPELGAASGVPAARMEFCFLAILALATAAALPVVGALLVFSLMVGPAAAARAFAPAPLAGVGLSVLLSLATVWAAIALSFETDWPIGFFVGTLGALLYGCGRLGIRGRSARS